MIKFPARNKRDIDNVASVIVRIVQPRILKGKEPLDVFRLIEIIEDDFQIDFDFTGTLPYGIDGCTSIDDNTVYINSELAEWYSNARYLNSTVTHEIGHVVIHVPYLRTIQKTMTFSQRKQEAHSINLYRDIKVPLWENPEWQAWHFAGALLMPAQVVTELIDKGITLKQLADHFNVNQPFLKSRLKKLGITMDMDD